MKPGFTPVANANGVVGLETALNMIVSDTPVMSEKLAKTALFEALREVGALLEAIAFHPGRSARSHLAALAASLVSR